MSRAVIGGIRTRPMQVQPAGCGGRDTAARHNAASRCIRSIIAVIPA
jgi:hypothetical protein